MIKFTTFKIADISTAHITEEDAKLMTRDAPCHLAEVSPDAYGEGATGSIFYVPEDLSVFLTYGFSAAFFDIMSHVKDQGIPYVRFDRDSDLVDGLPEFDW